MADETLKSAAADSMAGDDIRARVRDLTLAAIRARRLDFDAMREVMRDMSEGVATGAEKRGAEMKQALDEAFKGMDEAFTKSAYATQLAMQDLAARARDFNDTELRGTMEGLKHMEGDLLSAMGSAAERVGGRVRTETQEILAHAARVGTDTGGVVARTMTEFSQRMASAASDGARESVEAARLMSERMAQAASGFLAAMSETLAQYGQPKK
ncbi:MAG: DUF6781 family protein [Betaproteobacteria bacterium]|jgi:hypothetical protein|nr:hypothetical protein [Rhodocyclaceae bacterium]MCA3140752.1 hypothetical protein [Rhodocyclaceae bacterium]MCE2898885.1 hypothetical protein [Betaproteobacteria bacterium]